MTRRPLELTASVGLAAFICCAANAAPDKPEGIVVQDLAYGEVLFYFYQGDYFTALTRLLAAETREELPHHRADSELMLGALYLSYGEHRLAGEIFDRVLQQSVTPEVHDRAWFFLAKIWHERGYLAEAQNALARIGSELPDELEQQRLMLHSQVLMDLGRFDEALAALQAWDEPGDEWLGYVKFNIGVSLVRLGRIDEGARILNEVGELEPENRALDPLRDKANVALGYAWLQAERPAEAKPSLQRVRLVGPFSNKALLGVGWADAQIDDYESALAPWLELRNRDLMDSAVQEAFLAVPYAFGQLGATKQSADYYIDAVKAYEGEIERLTSSIETIRDGKMLTELLAQDPDVSSDAAGWYWRLENVPDSLESRYLYEVMATNHFQESLKNYRDLLSMNRNLDGWADSLGAFDDILDTKERAYRQRLPKINASLEGVDLDAMTARRVELESQLGAIERNADAVALGTAKEQESWRTLVAMEPQLAALSGDPAIAELATKQRFLKGLLLWDMSRDYKARLWAQKKSLIELDRGLREAQRGHHQVATARDEWPESFAAQTARIDGLRPRVLALQSSAQTAMARQEEFLREVAIEELNARRTRLNEYRVQAQFALASIYDRAAARVAPDAETVLPGPGR